MLWMHTAPCPSTHRTMRVRSNEKSLGRETCQPKARRRDEHSAHEASTRAVAVRVEATSTSLARWSCSIHAKARRSDEHSAHKSLARACVVRVKATSESLDSWRCSIQGAPHVRRRESFSRGSSPRARRGMVSRDPLTMTIE